MSNNKNIFKKYYLTNLWKNNQILVAILGICSALAVTIRVDIAITMSLAVIFVTGLSSLAVSIIRKWIPSDVRMITQLTIISLCVIIVDQFLKAYFYELSLTLSVFVGLIITNCLVMGRTETIAMHTRALPALLDGIGAASGYSLVLVAVGCIREFFGFGTLYGIQIIPLSWYASSDHPDRYLNCNLMALAPSAFFILGGFIWLYNTFSSKDSTP